MRRKRGSRGRHIYPTLRVVLYVTSITSSLRDWMETCSRLMHHARMNNAF
jgi:hypothetical protein